MRREFLVFSSTSGSDKADEEKDDKPGFNPFGFVTDNPSSRSAIQLPESPAEDGNVGQMLYVCMNPTFSLLFPNSHSVELLYV
jgi:hypothetical protein